MTYETNPCLNDQTTDEPQTGGGSKGDRDETVKPPKKRS
jgi:hypothetical protein